MLLPIIDSIIKEVNRLADESNSPAFDDELSSCIFIMENETNPDNLGYKLLMLNISLPILRKILTYFSILQLRADSFQTPERGPINQTALMLAIKGVMNAIAREEEPLKLRWKKVKSQSNSDRPEVTDTASPKDGTSPQNAPRPSTSASTASTSTVRASKRSSHRSSSKNTGSKAIAVTVPGTSQQIKIKQSSPTSDDGNGEEAAPVKELSRLAPPTRAKAVRSSGRRGRNPSMSSVSSVTPSTSPFSPISPFSPTSPFSERSPVVLRAPTTSPQAPSPLRDPVLPSPLSSSLLPSTSTRTPLPSIEPMLLSPDSRHAAVSLLPSTSSATSSDEPTYGLTVTFVVPVSIPIQQGLVRVLDPYRNKIETTPICGNSIFIKLKFKKDIYFLKRQIEILTRLSPRIVVTTFSRYQIEVSKQLSPTIKEFVEFNVSTLKGEFYVYSRAISEDNDNILIFEVLADAECRRSIENASCFLSIGVENRQAVLVECYKECARCFFCYADAHSECSNAVLMTESD